MIKQNYREWVATMDKEKIAAIADRKVWIFILITFLVIIYSASYLGIAAEFFQLQFVPTLVCLVPVAICAAVVSSVRLQNTIPIERFAILMLITSATFQFFMWSLVCFSEMPGAAVMAALPILLAAYHGEFFILSPKYLWGGLTTLSALIGALILAPDNDHRAIVGVGGIICLGAAFTMGGHARIHYQALKERDALKAAVDAQTLLDQVREVEQAQDLIYEIRGANHDAGNALSGILMNLELIQDIVAKDTVTEEDIREIKEMSSDLTEGSDRLRQMIEKGRDAGKEAADRELVNIINVAQVVIDEIKMKYPSVSQTVELDEALPEAYFLKLHGGELALNRVLNNLLINAHEGNGSRSASKVALKIHENKDHLKIAVKDNGPGFSEDQLRHTISNFKTTKESGTGLGLYTSLRLISANSGELDYKNNSEGGACVTISLPRQVV